MPPLRENNRFYLRERDLQDIVNAMATVAKITQKMHTLEIACKTVSPEKSEKLLENLEVNLIPKMKTLRNLTLHKINLSTSNLIAVLASPECQCKLIELTLTRC